MRKSNIAIDNSQVSSLIFPAKKRVDFTIILSNMFEIWDDLSCG
jgi:hypothetical protein